MPTVTDNQINLGEYRAVLPAEQTANFSEVKKVFDDLAFRRKTEDQCGDMLEKYYRQPIMAGLYRKNGIEPEQVEDFIQFVKKDYPQKGALVNGFYGVYGQAAHAQEGFENGELKVEGKKELEKLALLLENSATINNPMRRFVDAQKQKEAELNTASSAIKDIVKGAKVIAAGVVAAIALTPLAQRLMKITAKEDMQKVEARQKQLAKQQNMQKTANMHISKDKVND